MDLIVLFRCCEGLTRDNVQGFFNREAVKPCPELKKEYFYNTKFLQSNY